MMAKRTFELSGRVESVLIAPPHGDGTSVRVPKIQVVRGYGVRGDSHAGPRLADVREREMLAFGLPKGIEIANFREFSAVADEELQEIAATMGVPAVPYGCLAENLVVSGIPKFSELPAGTMLFFRKNVATQRTAVLAVWRENMPCEFPGRAIERLSGVSGVAQLFPKAAHGRRGVVGCVYASGIIHQGDQVVAVVPEPRLSPP